MLKKSRNINIKKLFLKNKLKLIWIIFNNYNYYLNKASQCAKNRILLKIVYLITKFFCDENSYEIVAIKFFFIFCLYKLS